MACVRPGVEETCACFEPTSAFSRLDLPTLDRPRNATSGAPGLGNCSGARAERRNFGRRRIPSIVAERRGAGLGVLIQGSGWPQLAHLEFPVEAPHVAGQHLYLPGLVSA